MQQITNWSALWRELAEMNNKWRQKAGDDWGYQPEKAQEFAERVASRWQMPDSSREFILTCVTPTSTVLDIGSGPGAWSALLAKRVKAVTAVEPAPAMVAQMRNLLEQESISNVKVLQEFWPHAQVEMHDFSLCSHAMYGTTDLPAFIHRINEVTAETCFLLIRAAAMDGVMAIAARRVLGHPHDSPNFTVAFNVLMEMGIYANVLMESSGPRRTWTHASLEEALDDIKLRLDISGSTTHDDYLMDLLKRRLTPQDGKYVWPPGVRSALIYWDVV